MRSFQQRLSIFTSNSANLLIQISELNETPRAAQEALQAAPEIAEVEAAEKNAN
jgi:hypothetical protein